LSFSKKRRDAQGAVQAGAMVDVPMFEKLV
jgi:hypothetical protein